MLYVCIYFKPVLKMSTPRGFCALISSCEKHLIMIKNEQNGSDLDLLRPSYS